MVNPCRPRNPGGAARVAAAAATTVLVFLLFSLSQTAVLRGERADLLRHVRFLASDELRGRGNDQPELKLAAEYIEREFAGLGLRPAGENGTYFQSFEVPTGIEVGPDGGVAFFAMASRPIHLRQGVDYRPLTFGSAGVVTGPLVFVGFGITAPEYRYDDYAHVDVAGKIVVMWEHEPQETSTGSPFGGRDLTPHSTVMTKVMNAKQRGAEAVVIIPDTFQHMGDPRDTFEDVKDETVLDLGIQSILLSSYWGDRLLESSGYRISDLARWISGHMTPNSFDILGLNGAMSLDVSRVRHIVRNVLGFVPGRKEEVIVVGAHYDHLGLGGKSSLAPGRVGEIHNGADDNASGVAGMLELARLFSQSRPRYNLLFVAFAGEELGLLGSRFYVENPWSPLNQVVAMLNLDMIGRSRGELLVGGVGTAIEFREILEDVEQNSPLVLKLAQTASGPSDHLSFALKRVPVLFFFSGLHSDYHKPTDDWEGIEQEETYQVVDVVREIVVALDRQQAPLHYVDLGTDYPSFGYPEPDRDQDRPYFGSIPDMGFEGRGLRFTQIREGSPADSAGVRDGDVLVEMGGKRVDNLYDFTYGLRQFVPGDAVKIEVLREGRHLALTVILGDWPY